MGANIVPTYECKFYIGQAVRLASPYAEDDPSLVYYVTGINWEYRTCINRGWNITIATASDITNGYGQTDGFTPSDLLPADNGYVILSPDEAAQVAELKAELDLLQDIIDSRPAINAALPDSYIRWSQAIYSGDAIRSLKGGRDVT